MCGLVSDLVIRESKVYDIVHNDKYLFWNRVYLKNKLKLIYIIPNVSTKTGCS